MTPGTRGRKKLFCSDDCSRISRRKLPVETACWFCGKALDGLGKSGFPKRYCDRVCASKLRVKQDQETRDTSSVCTVCSLAFVGRTRNRRYCGEVCRVEGNRLKATQRWQEFLSTQPEFKEWDCEWCGLKVQVPRSLTGGRKYHDDCRGKARRARNRIKTLKRQGVKTDKRITHEEVAERDNFVCYLCDAVVDMSLPRTSKLGATLDHVIPVSKGGEDCLENLRLAHWICNIRKSDKILGVGHVASEA